MLSLTPLAPAAPQRDCAREKELQATLDIAWTNQAADLRRGRMYERELAAQQRREAKATFGATLEHASTN